MKHSLLLTLLAAFLCQAPVNAQVKQAKNTSDKKAAPVPAVNSEYNTTVFYNDKMREVKSKGQYYLLINMDGNGLPSGKSKLVFAKDDQVSWEGEYFLFNRVEPEKSKYQGQCTWYYPNKQKKRESSFRDGALDGKTTLYNQEGKVIYAGTYKNGKLQGLWTHYDDKGNVGKAYLQQFDLMYDSWQYEGKDGYSFVEDGTLVIHSNTKDGYAVRDLIPVESGRDFTIETEFRLRTPEAMFMYGQRDTANYYGVTITSKGTLTLNHATDGVEKGGGQSFKVSLNKDGNLLRIMKMGDDVFISVNGNMVTSYKFTRFYGNNFGIYIPGKGEVLVYSIIAKELSKTKGRPEAADVRESNPEPVAAKTATPAKEGEWRPAGTGLFLSGNGLVLTNYRAVAGASSIGVTQTSNGKRVALKAKVIATDEQNDLAILKVEDSRYVSPGAIPYVLSPAVAEVGESIFALSFPLTDLQVDELQLSDAVVSSRSGAMGDSRVYQISAAAGSGGPVLNKQGNVIGLTSAALSGKAPAGSFSVKSSLILNAIQSLDNPPKLGTANTLKGKPLKDQMRILRGFVPMIVVQ